MSERLADDNELNLRFAFQSGHLKSTCVAKQLVNVRPNPDKDGRLELSLYVLDYLNGSTFWEDMPTLGGVTREAKGYGKILTSTVRSLQREGNPIGLDVEVNHKPNAGHCDVIGWSDDKEIRIIEQREFAKAMDSVRRKDGDLTDEKTLLLKNGTKKVK